MNCWRFSIRPMKSPDPCRALRRDPLITVQENGRTFILRNECRQPVTQVQVDDCLITIGERCDWLFELVEPAPRVLFVELKGRNLKHAYAQLLTTIRQLKGQYRGYRLEAYVVASRNPQTSAGRDLLAKELAQLGVRLTVKNVRLELDICP